MFGQAFRSIADILRKPEEIGRIFTGFQKYLYREASQRRGS